MACMQTSSSEAGAPNALGGLSFLRMTFMAMAS